MITELAPISVVFSLPQDDLVRVTRRLAAEKTPAVEAFDRDLRKKLATGTLVTLDNQIDAEHGHVPPEGRRSRTRTGRCSRTSSSTRA